MSVQCTKVVKLILLDRFGPAVAQMAEYLMNSGPATLYSIRKWCQQMDLAQIKDALRYLIKHKIIEHKSAPYTNTVFYGVNHQYVLQMLRYPKYVKIAEQKFGREGELLIDQILLEGYCSAPYLIERTAQRLMSTTQNSTVVSVQRIKDVLFDLIQWNYLKQFGSDTVPVNRSDLDQSNLHYCVHFERFHHDMRSQLIIDSFSRRFDSNAGHLIQILLQHMNCGFLTTPLSNRIPEPILKRAIGNLPELTKLFEQYMCILEQDSAYIIQKFDDSYQLNFRRAIEVFVWELLEKIIRQKFDSKAARIFRLIKSKVYIEPDQIQQLAMIPAKEAKILTYQLLEENFIQVQELRKTIGNGPHKSFTLFYVDLEQTVRMLLELSYKTLFNAMLRRSHEHDENKRIIDKKQKIDTILLGMRAQGVGTDQLQDIEEMITPMEREVLQSTELKIRKLNASELEIDETIFLLQLYLMQE